MPDGLKKVGVQFVSEGQEVANQVFQDFDKGIQTSISSLGQLGQLFTQVMGTEAAAVQLGVVQGAQRAQEAQETWIKLLNERQTLEQQEVVKAAQNAADYVAFWEKAIADKEGFFKDATKATTEGEQQAVVAAAQAAQEYVAVWEKAFADEEAYFTESNKATTEAEQQFVVDSAQRAKEYQAFWEQANLNVTQSRQGGTGTPAQTFSQEELQNLRQIVEEGQAAGKTFSDVALSIQNIGVATKQSLEITGQFWKEQQQVNQVTAEGISLKEFYTKQLLEQGVAEKDLATVLAQIQGAQRQVVTEEVSESEAAKIVMETHQRISQAYADEQKQLQLLTQGLAQLEQVETEEEQEARIIMETHQRVSQGYADNERQTKLLSQANKGLNDSSIQVGLAFFALSIAARGVRDVGRELGQIYGNDVAQGFSKVADVLQTIGSFGSGGALIGSLFGAAGTAVGAGIGASVGVLASLPAILDQTSEATKALIQEFSQLGTKQDAAAILKQIGDLSSDDANQLVKLAKAGDDFSQRFVQDLDRAAKAQQEFENAQPSTLQRIGGNLIDPSGTLIDNEIARRTKLAQADQAAAQAALQQDSALAKLVVEYDNVKAATDKWVSTGDAALDLIKETTGFTDAEVKAVQDAVKAHPQWSEALGENARNIELLKIGLKDAPQYTDDYTKALKDQTDQLKQNAQELLAVAEADKKTAEIRSTLAKDTAGSSDTQQLQDLSGVTQDVSDRFLKFAKSHEEVAQKAALLVQQINEDQESLARLGAQGVTTGAQVDGLTAQIKTDEEALKGLVSTHQDYSDILEQSAAAQDKFSKALQEASFRMGELETKTRQQRAAAQQQYQDTVDNANRAQTEADAAAEQTRTDRLADLYVQRADRLADIQSQFNDRIADINQQLADREADIQQQLTDKIADIQHQLQTRLAELQHQYQQQIQQANDKIAQAAQQLADQLFNIERTRIEATEALGFNTHEQLEAAKTDHDRQRILEQAQFQQGQIDQRANDARTDAEKQFAEKVQEAEKEKKLAHDNYEYELKLAKEQADYQIQQARRQAAEQIAQAERQAKEQRAIAEREEQQQIALAQRQYEEQKALADRARNEAVAKDAQAERDKLADAQRALNERNAAITASYQLERDQINETLKVATEAYDAVVKQFAEMFQLAIGFAKQLLQLSQLEQQIAGYRGPGNPIGEGNLPAYTPPPPPEPTPTTTNYGGRAGQGQIVSPVSTTSNTNSQSLNFYIYDATDPQKVGQVVKQMFGNTTRIPG